MDLEEAEKRQAAQEWEFAIKHESIIPSLRLRNQFQFFRTNMVNNYLKCTYPQP